MQNNRLNPPEPLRQPDGAATAAASTARRARPPVFASLRHRNFQLYFGGQLISVAGTWMQIVAQGWLVYQISHSETVLGIVGFASAIPALLITPLAGVVIDRVHKRDLLVITQTTAMILAFILAWLTFSGRVQVWHIVLLAVGLGVFNAFDAPGRQAFVVEMVGRDDLMNAIALQAMVFNSARIIGPAVGGVLLATLGAGWCFLINGISFLAVIAGLLLMRMPRVERQVVQESPFESLGKGVRYVRGQAEILGLILLSAVFSFFGMSYTTVLPAFVDQVLHQGAASYGLINAASGTGAVLGALAVAAGMGARRRGKWLTLAVMAFPLALAFFAYTTWLPLSMLLSAALGLGFMLQFTLMNTIIQTRVSDEMRGRVMGLYTVTFFGVAPFGNILIGWASERFGLSLSITISALVAFALSQLLLRRFRQVRAL